MQLVFKTKYLKSGEAMNNLYLYFLALIIPLPICYFLFDLVGVWEGIISLLLYVFIYRPYIDSLRLYQLGLINKEDQKKWFIPLHKAYWYPVTHFRSLYFKKTVKM